MIILTFLYLLFFHYTIYLLTNFLLLSLFFQEILFPYLNQQFWGINEKLTHNGYRQHQLLGKYIRKKYIDTKFISDKYNERDFKIYSTPFQRTIFSANGFLSGLYPNYISKVNFHENQLKYINNDIIPNIDFNVNFEEIPIEVLSYQENVLFNSWKCKLNGELIKEESKDLNLYPDVIPISDDDIIETANYLRKYLLLEDKIAELKKVKKSRKFIKKVNKCITGYFYFELFKCGKNISGKKSERSKKFIIFVLLIFYLIDIIIFIDCKN